MTTFFRYKKYTIVGFYDSDGTFTVRITRRRNNYVGFSLLSSFTQTFRNAEILTAIQSQIGGNFRAGQVLEIYLATESGERWLQLLKRNLPMVPGKRKDYLISLKILEFATSDPTFRYLAKNSYKYRSFPELENGGIFGREFDAQQKDKIGSIAAVYIRYEMTHESFYGQLQEDIRDWILHLAPTFSELYFGVKLGKHFLREINREVNQLRNRLLNGKKLKKSYVIGHFIGDGSMGFNIKKPNANEIHPFVSFLPFFFMEEAAHSWEINVAFATTFGLPAPQPPEEGDSAHRFSVGGWNDCANIIVPYFSSCNLPAFRQRQYNIFAKVCKMGVNHQLYTFPGYVEMTNLFWNMSRERETFDLQEAIELARVELMRRKNNPKTTTGCRSRVHVRLRQQFLYRNRLRSFYRTKYSYLENRFYVLFPKNVGQ